MKKYELVEVPCNCSKELINTGTKFHIWGTFVDVIVIFEYHKSLMVRNKKVIAPLNCDVWIGKLIKQQRRLLTDILRIIPANILLSSFTGHEKESLNKLNTNVKVLGTTAIEDM